MIEQTPLLRSDKDEIRLLRLADEAVKDLDRVINDLPRPVVYYCKGIEQIRELKQHFKQCIEDWTKRLPGSQPFTRKVFTALIERAQYELKEIKKVLEAINV